jgi:hypothetical protein
MPCHDALTLYATFSLRHWCHFHFAIIFSIFHAAARYAIMPFHAATLFSTPLRHYFLSPPLFHWFHFIFADADVFIFLLLFSLLPLRHIIIISIYFDICHYFLSFIIAIFITLRYFAIFDFIDLMLIAMLIFSFISCRHYWCH